MNYPKKIGGVKKKIISSSEEEEEDSQVGVLNISEFPDLPQDIRKNDSTEVSASSSRRLLLQESQAHVMPRSQCSTPSSRNDEASSSRRLPLQESQTYVMSRKPDEGFEEKLFKELSFIRVHLVKIGQQLSVLELNMKSHQLQDNDKNEEKHDNFEEIIRKFPLDTELDLRNMEVYLLNNPDFKKYLINYCSRLGGLKIDQITKIMLRKLISNKLAANYSWLGAKKKQSFNLLIAEVILCAVKQNKLIGETTEKEMIDSVKNWLKHAHVRYTNQCKREQKGAEEPTG
ncbi:uncharacterized protein LOC116182236 isoform X1 [Photinus pyralis]|uniref:uncharacterized protein LOC116181871 isoform X1 n=2 Tax=Photinus pyralis TaxID=7054 RepID=UPI001267688C|nr:uncharacterized protein LOC116181871 isoform X1 [Photinus pyralis]XP_031358177.1 uncharacterized protein LOC116181871 isoform X1 [Photinus pyralis]XP_031358615.1 uncharacterized protein LOC116182236 isoform X1 [Photinus pyralis]